MPSQKKSPADRAVKPTKQRTVEADHTIKFRAPTIVDAENLAPEEVGDQIEDALLDFDDEEVGQVKRPPTVKQKLKAKFEQRGIGGSEQLTLRIDRLPLFEQNGMAGVKADKEFCASITCTDSYFDNDLYLIEIQRRYGPGEYWLTLRHKNSIIQQWRERLGGFASPVPVQTTGADGQVGPQTIIYQTPGQPPQVAPAADPLLQLRGALKIIKDFKDDLGLIMPTAAQQAPAPLDPEVALLQGLAGNDKFMDKIQNGALRKILGDKAADDDPSYASVAMEMVKTGQAETAIRAIGEIVMNVVNRIIPSWGANNGPAQMVATQIQDQNMSDVGQVQISPLSNVQAGSPAQSVAISPGDRRSAGRQVDGRHPAPNASLSQTAPAQGAPGQPPTLMQIIQRLPINSALQIVIQGQATAQDIALAKVIDGCGRKANPERTVDWVFQFADEINAQLPDHSIDAEIELFGAATVDQILAFVGKLPGGDQVIALPHAREWTTELQRVIAENQPEGEDAA